MTTSAEIHQETQEQQEKVTGGTQVGVFGHQTIKIMYKIEKRNLEILNATLDINWKKITKNREQRERLEHLSFRSENK